MYAKLERNYKRLVTFILISILIIAIALSVIMSLFITSEHHRVYIQLLSLVLYVVFLFFLLIIMGIFSILISQPKKKTHPLLLNWMKFSFKTLYPFIYAVGKLMGIEKDPLRGIYAQLNNYLIEKDRINVQAKELLLLAPQCIQRAECPYKITTNINNCKRCGKCKIVDLIHISNKYGIQLSVVTGGTSARNIVTEKKPKAIVAIACERDLSSGIHDVKVIPVIGIVN